MGQRESHVNYYCYTFRATRIPPLLFFSPGGTRHRIVRGGEWCRWWRSARSSWCEKSLSVSSVSLLFPSSRFWSPLTSTSRLSWMRRSTLNKFHVSFRNRCWFWWWWWGWCDAKRDQEDVDDHHWDFSPLFELFLLHLFYPILFKQKRGWMSELLLGRVKLVNEWSDEWK